MPLKTSVRFNDKKKSLIYSNVDTNAFKFMTMPNNPIMNDQVQKTSVYKLGQTNGSVFLDISNRKEKLKTILQLIAQQYPSRNGVYLQKEDGFALLEINFGLRNPDFDTILNNGIRFNDQSILMPCIALNHQVNPTFVLFYNLPLFAEDPLRNLLKSSLSQYGTLLDVGILLEPNTDTYMGCGYAIIDIPSDLKVPLNPVIKYDNNEFFAVWNWPVECDIKEQDYYKDYILFTLKQHRQYIWAEVKTVAGKYEYFNIRRDAPLSELKDAYSERMEVSQYDIRFFSGRRQIWDDELPGDYDRWHLETFSLEVRPRS
jgi:hypothetical protein